MSDGILKSDPDGIWDYFTTLNRSLEQLNEAVEDASRTLDRLENRLEKTRKDLQETVEEKERTIQNLLSQMSQAKDQDERSRLEASIAAIRAEIAELEEKISDLIRASRRLGAYREGLIRSQKICTQNFSEGKKVLNAYLKLIEVHAAQEEFHEYSVGNGRYGALQYRGVTFYCDNEAFDPNAVDSKGRTNIRRMEGGLAPIGYDGTSVELHHLIQSESGSIMEISGSKHRAGHSVLHINPSEIPSGINRSSFDVLRAAYWKKRASLLK